MAKKIIHVLEDDPGCSFIYGEVLTPNYETKVYSEFSQYENALKQGVIPYPDLLLADLQLQDGHFLKDFNQSNLTELLKVPFIVVSSDAESETIRACFQSGACDYLSKPFKPAELLVKIERVISTPVPKSDVQLPVSDAVSGSAGLGSISLQPTLGNQEFADLTLKEHKIISVFLKSSEAVATKTDILGEVWSNVAVNPKTFDVHLYNLRRKLIPKGLLITYLGQGRWKLEKQQPIASAS